MSDNKIAQYQTKGKRVVGYPEHHSINYPW
jgi:hypothetical protein